jgi:hypothetical protein
MRTINKRLSLLNAVPLMANLTLVFACFYSEEPPDNAGVGEDNHDNDGPPPGGLTDADFDSNWDESYVPLNATVCECGSFVLTLLLPTVSKHLMA